MNVGSALRAGMALVERQQAAVGATELRELAEALADVRRLSAELTEASLTGSAPPSRTAQRAADRVKTHPYG